MSQDANKMLLNMMSPDQARLMDQQLRQQQINQGATNYGTDAMGRFLTAASGAQRATQGLGMLGQRLISGERLKGANELAVEQRQQRQQVTAEAIKGATGAGRVEQLRNVAKRLRDTGDFNNMMLAEQYEAKADQIELKIQEIGVKRFTAAAKSQGQSVYEGLPMKDEDGNLYQTLSVYDKDTKQSTTQYLPQGHNIPYDGERKLTVVAETGEGAGLTPQEIVDLGVTKETREALGRKYSERRDAAFDNIAIASSIYNSLSSALALIEEESAKGNLEGGLSAKLQNALYDLTGTRPANLGELNMIFNLETFKQLRPLFGGQISDGERESVVDIFPNIFKGGEVNLRLVKRMQAAAKSAMAQTRLLISTEDAETYANSILELYPEEDKTTLKGDIRPDVNVLEGLSEQAKQLPSGSSVWNPRLGRMVKIP